MIIEQANYVEGCRIDDAWRDAMWLCILNGYDYVVRKGSYQGQIRRQLPYITIRITAPGTRPLAPIMPPNISPSTTDESILNYFVNSLMNEEVLPNQQYTYGNYIVPQLPRVIDILTEGKGDTNQATITIGDKNSVNLKDPPCLKVIDFKVVAGRKLNMTVFFRSWDLYAGLPENLGGFQLLKEYVVDSLPKELGISDGELIASSNGLHIYEHFFELANLLNIDKIEINKKILQDKEEFTKTLDNIQE